MMEKIIKSEGEWRRILPPEVYRVMRERGTEAPFTCVFKNPGAGVYNCAACGQPVFGSKSGYESGSGWPSYAAPLNQEYIEERPDSSFGMSRIEVLCGRCGSHLGHVFDDGPPPAGKRYCINSVALKFVPAEK